MICANVAPKKNQKRIGKPLLIPCKATGNPVRRWRAFFQQMKDLLFPFLTFYRTHIFGGAPTSTIEWDLTIEATKISEVWPRILRVNKTKTISH